MNTDLNFTTYMKDIQGRSPVLDNPRKRIVVRKSTLYLRDFESLKINYSRSLCISKQITK